MGKVILVLDRLVGCDYCPLFQCDYGNDYTPTCLKAEREVPYPQKPDWCPLQSPKNLLPERKDTVSIMQLGKDAEARGVSTKEQISYNLGWNECLDAILKKTEGE